MSKGDVVKYQDLVANKIVFAKRAKILSKETDERLIACRYNRRFLFLQTPRMTIRNFYKIGDKYYFNFNFEASSGNKELHTFYNKLNEIESYVVSSFKDKFQHWFPQDEYDASNVDFGETHRSPLHCGDLIDVDDTLNHISAIPYFSCALDDVNGTLYGYTYSTRLKPEDLKPNDEVIMILRIVGIHVDRTSYRTIYEIVQLKTLKKRNRFYREPTVQLNELAIISDDDDDDSDSDSDDGRENSIIYDTEVESQQIIPYGDEL